MYKLNACILKMTFNIIISAAIFYINLHDFRSKWNKILN